MRRLLLVGLSLLLILGMVSAGLIGCTSPTGEQEEEEEEEEEEPKELEPCVVDFEALYSGFAGTESMTFFPTFTIYNPNDYLVTIDSFRYSIICEDKLIGGAEIIDDIYIPAKETIRIEDGFTMILMNLIPEIMVGTPGMSMGEAMAAGLDLWKTLGGLCPSGAKA